MYCRYYQARVNEKDCWFFVAIMRSFEHLMFDRTLDKKTSTFEFFVPAGLEVYFLQVMDYFIAHKIVSDLKQYENRLQNPAETL
jgi:hypothetical protein